ncbi:MAG TPA: SCP2 sterol-binding domain-containing protein [Steroidobacteraceae bacterium]|nr:SCP2 sterol-binding domain-containing protein [Steroidobacteraceae bacterium]
MTPELLKPLESLLNRNIAGSSRARGLLARIAGRSLELRLAPTPLKLRFVAGADRVSLSMDGDAPADATIEGSPFTFARLAMGNPMQTLRAGGAQVTGDGEIAQGFQQLFEAAQPDFEEELSRLTGDVAARHLANLARDAVDFGRRARETFLLNVAEYLTEESRDVPLRAEVEEFVAGVDALREATDRLEARLAGLERSRQ